jgi:MraZ protein
MLLTGQYPRTLDDKNRLVFPKRIREQLREPERLWLSPGQDRRLWVYTEQELERFREKIDQLPATDAEVRAFRTLFYARTEPVDMDRSGRILLPEHLIQFAGLTREVVLTGAGEHLEIWDAARWAEYETQNAPRYDAVAESAFKK